MPQLYENIPRLCANCYQQLTDTRYVEWEAAFDGPVLKARSTNEGVEALAVDDLVMCETCVKAGATLLGLVNAADLVKEYDEAKTYMSRLERRLTSHKETIRNLQDSVEKLLNARQVTEKQAEEYREQVKEPIPA